ncbi:MAG TPA: lysophospholipid acyltransferase family protein [Pseudobdellovibrionaceae bacterium]|nr:lysophospholipid acyltransferase family protein [Pseudobdellovibrionaceae bacterium]
MSPTGLLRTASQMAGMVSYIGAYTGQGYSAHALIRDQQERLRFHIHNVSRWCRRALRLLNFEIEEIGLEKIDFEKENFLVVANHMSYVDVLVMSSKHPMVFITSKDMGEQFFIGTMCELGGSIFIERRHRGQVAQDLSAMRDTLAAGFNVMIFPEGTSTNGHEILPFKKSLLMSAVEARKRILPVAVRYVRINGQPFDKVNCDKVAWYGDMTFADHFVGLCGLSDVKVQLVYGEPISVPENLEGVDASELRTRLATEARDQIVKMYDLPALLQGR